MPFPEPSATHQTRLAACAELTLPGSLSDDAREFARGEALKLGLKTSSIGTYQLTVSKYRESDRERAKLSISFTSESHKLVQEYLEKCASLHRCSTHDPTL